MKISQLLTPGRAVGRHLASLPAKAMKSLFLGIAKINLGGQAAMCVNLRIEIKIKQGLKIFNRRFRRLAQI